jgi:hypothetical protein
VLAPQFISLKYYLKLQYYLNFDSSVIIESRKIKTSQICFNFHRFMFLMRFKLIHYKAFHKNSVLNSQIVKLFLSQFQNYLFDIFNDTDKFMDHLQLQLELVKMKIKENF